MTNVLVCNSFWPLFSVIRTEFRGLQDESVWMRECGVKQTRKKVRMGHFSRSVTMEFLTNAETYLGPCPIKHLMMELFAQKYLMAESCQLFSQTASS